MASHKRKVYIRRYIDSRINRLCFVTIYYSLIMVTCDYIQCYKGYWIVLPVTIFNVTSIDAFLTISILYVFIDLPALEKRQRLGHLCYLFCVHVQKASAISMLNHALRNSLHIEPIVDGPRIRNSIFA